MKVHQEFRSTNKLKTMIAFASSYHQYGPYPVNLAFDGLLSTFWHTIAYGQGKMTSFNQNEFIVILLQGESSK